MHFLKCSFYYLRCLNSLIYFNRHSQKTITEKLASCFFYFNASFFRFLIFFTLIAVVEIAVLPAQKLIMLFVDLIVLAQMFFAEMLAWLFVFLK